jgi:CMP-N-acetylneuraminic acid synthetase
MPRPDDERSLAVIPARGGSTRVPRKNVRLLGDRPLLAWVVRAALETKLFADVVVSTDDAEVAEVAAAAGAEVHRRPEYLADDHAPSSLATCDALEALERSGRSYELVAQLLPTSPFVLSSDIVAAARHLLATGADSCLSLAPLPPHVWWAMRLGGGEAALLEPLFPKRLLERSQDLPPVYSVSGAVWWSRAAGLRERRSFYAAAMTGWPLPLQRAFEIDTEADWTRAIEMLPALQGG